MVDEHNIECLIIIFNRSMPAGIPNLNEFDLKWLLKAF